MPGAARDPSADDGEVRWVVPPDTEAEITALLHIQTPARRWSLVDWVARGEWIDARYRSRSGALAIVRLLPPHRVPPVEHVQTRRFSIARLRGDADGLLEALAEWSTTRGLGFAWQRVEPTRRPAPPEPTAPVEPPIETDPRAIDVERALFRARLKPGLRLRFAARDMAHEAWLQLREGSSVAILLLGGPDTQAVLLAARTRADAEAMLAAQVDESGPDPAIARAATMALGERLGYPSCCVEAFVDTLDYTQVATRGQVPPRETDDWPRIQRAWSPRPNPRLNCLLFGERLHVISFQPCSFTCEAASALADRKFEHVARAFPVAAIALARALARPVAVDPQNRRAWVELAVDDQGDSRIVAAEPIRTNEQIDPQPLVARLLGRRVDALGWVEHDTPIRVLRFDLAGSAPEPLELGPPVGGADPA